MGAWSLQRLDSFLVLIGLLFLLSLLCRSLLLALAKDV